MGKDGGKTGPRKIPDEIKIDAAAESIDQGSIRKAAAKFKVHPSMVARWQKNPRYRDQAKAKVSLTLQEIARLSSQKILIILEDPKTDLNANQLVTILGITLDKYMTLEGISANAKGTKDDPIYNRIEYSIGPVQHG